MEKKDHNIGIDVIRIIAGFGVILLHVTDPFIIHPLYLGVGGSSWWIINCLNVLFRASVPLFVMISGFLLLDQSKKFDSKTFYKRRFAKIGIPSVVWIIFYLCLFIYLGQISSPLHLLQKILTLDILHLYFVVLIVELYFLTPLLLRILKDPKINPHLLLISTFLLTSIVSATNALFPLEAVNISKNITTVFLPFLFYYLLGPLFKKVRLSISSVLSLGIIYVYMAVFIAIISGGIVTSYSREFEGLPMILMSVMAFAILYQTNSLSFLKNWRLQQVISYLSSLVFGVYLVHMAVLIVLDHVYVIAPGQIGSPMWVYVVIKVVIVWAISLTITALGKKLPLLKYLFT